MDLKTCGLHKYVESPDFEILVIGYAYEDEEVRILDLTEIGNPVRRRSLPPELQALVDPTVRKVAHNCAFERACLQRFFGYYLPPEEWEDTMILAAMNGLPMTLEGAGAALMFEKQKMQEGKELITKFCKPDRKGHRRLPSAAPEDWALFKTYCCRDVDVERQIYHLLAKSIPITEDERAVFCLDARINERGVLVDTTLAASAIQLSETDTEKASAEYKMLTGIDKPNSVVQLKAWLKEQAGLEVQSLDKAAVADLLSQDLHPTVRRVLELRTRLGKTSVSKYEAMLRAACVDGRVRGITQYYGAARTGRWAGRLVQLQNLPQNHLTDIDLVRDLVRRADYESLSLLYDSVLDTLSQLIRTAFIAKEGHTFLVADYSAIEARVTAYLANEQWRLEAFAAGKDIYCQSASLMFHCPVEKHGVNGHLRQKGKIAELACGYGGGVGALKAFGADKMGLSEAEMQEIVDQWRTASPMIVMLWKRLESAAVRALQNRGQKVAVYQKVYRPEVARQNAEMVGADAHFSPYFNTNYTVCVYKFDGKALRCILPSGRVLSYWSPRLEGNAITYMAQNQTSKKWERIETWGGKLVENVVQAFARDCLAVAMLRLDKAGYEICFHVHDEIIAEAPIGSHWEDMAAIMSQPVPWAPGLLLHADGYETPFYKKD